VIITTGRPGGNPAGQDHGRRFRHAQGRYDAVRLLDTLAFAQAVRSRRSRLVWLNPAPTRRWRHSTAGQIARHLPMSEIDAMGMHRAVDVLRGHPPQVERPL
jgi:uncharacterized protein